VPGDAPTMQFQYKSKDGKAYKALNRGEFFAWVNMSKDLK
jgi:hypothetical protein